MAKKVTRRKKATKAERPLGLTAAATLESIPSEAKRLAGEISTDGGAVIGVYRDPFGGRGLVLAALPIDQVEPTPFQRDASKAHAQKLENVMQKTGRFLDPIIAVRHEPKRYWTPNGNHRLVSMRALNAQAITALVVPEEDAAYLILALNTEKAHNLREKALEVIRMARSFADLSRQNESEFAFQFEEPALLTLGMCYEQKGRFSGGPYQPILRRGESFRDQPIKAALAERTKRAAKLIALDEAVDGLVKQLKERGLTSAYLKPFVVARLNPFRFQKNAEPPPIDELLDKMLAAAKKFDPAKIRPEDVSRAAGPPVVDEE